jgi:hypothetical protein
MELWIKAGLLIAAAIGAGKTMYDLAIGKHVRMRDEYKFAKEFFDALQDSPLMHPYLRQKGYQAIAGDELANVKEVETLLQLEDADRALKDFALGRKYLVVDADGPGHARIDFKPRFRRRFSRLWRILASGSLYVGCFALVVSPLVLTEFGLIGKSPALGLLLLTTLAFGPSMWFALQVGIRVRRAEILVRDQRRHVAPIAVTRGGGA